jgi:AAT family amino acid transporter
VLVQGWSCFSPTFSGVDFVSYYIELPVMLLMFVVWKLVKKTKFKRVDEMDFETDVYEVQPGELEKLERPGWKGKVETAVRWVF